MLISIQYEFSVSIHAPSHFIFSPGYLQMALAYVGKGDYELALKQTAKALKRDKNYPDIYLVQGLHMQKCLYRCF